MKTIIDLTNAVHIQMPYISDEEAKTLSNANKGWSLSSVYNLEELRDIFIALRQWQGNDFELKRFTNYCDSINLPFSKTKWNERRVLEHLNALKNFGLANSSYELTKHVFINSKIGSPLSVDDLQVFREIYFGFFRFKELLSWLINPSPPDKARFIANLSEREIFDCSRPIFCFSEKSRFTDSFIYEMEDNSPVYFLKEKIENGRKNDEDLMRFWDVFIKWGTVLGILEKFNLRNLDIKTSTGRNIACVYVARSTVDNFDLLAYLRANYEGTYIYLPQLVLELAIKFRLKIESIHQLIIDGYKSHKEFLSFERTSEIFVKKQEIKEGDRILFPKYNDSYISHVIVRR
jgi:hypothetical protein